MWKLFLDVADGTFRLNGGKGTPHTHCTSDFTSPPPHIKQHKSGNQHFLMGNCIAPYSELAYWGARCSRHAEYFWWSQVVPNLLVETPPTGLKVRLKGHELMSDRREKRKQLNSATQNYTKLHFLRSETCSANSRCTCFAFALQSNTSRVWH